MRHLLGVVHLPPCPSACAGPPEFDALLEAALADAQALRDGGVDGVIVENYGDVPFHKGTRDDPAPPDVVATLAVVAREVRRTTGLPVGINCLRNDACAALGAAAVAGATWVRVNVLTGAMLTDQGVIEGEARRVADYRQRLDHDVRMLADLLVKHAVPFAPTDPLVAARDLASRSGADGLIVTGARTGAAVDPAFLREVRAAVAPFPVWIGSGLTPENAQDLWPHCDGAIVGTSLKQHGRTLAPVDVARVRRLRTLCS